MDSIIPTVGIILAGTSIIVGAAVAYLTLFVKGKIADSEDKILTHIDEKFALKELMLQKFEAMEKNNEVQFKAFDGRMSAIERNK